MTGAPDGLVVPAQANDQWAEAYCALVNRHPDGIQATSGQDGWTEISFREMAKNEINAMLASRPTANLGGVFARPAVLAFARLMEQQLQANDWKGGWQNDAAIALLRRLREETNELSREIEAAGDRVWRDWDPAAHAASALSHSQVIVSFVPGRGWFCADIHTPKRFNPDVDAKRRIGEEAADVANFAMMIADVSGAFGPGE